jgi:hypothetical protein
VSCSPGSPQKLLQRAYQRDREAIERWQRVSHPAIARQVRTEEVLVPMPCIAGPGVSPILLTAE